jgi:hypothetical protein
MKMRTRRTRRVTAMMRTKADLRPVLRDVIKGCTSG